MISNLSLSKTSTSRPLALATSTARSASIRAVKYAGGIFAKSRAKIAAADVVRPRSIPDSVPRARSLEHVIVSNEGLDPFADFKSV
ncbi:unannotated protein [freshwater metagenome]|uniref:Unannotated protein n=1 Tax=freshwater metagenome TaxID=449393 RepID=A0A6J6GKE5_9ZZZZ